MIKTSAQEAYYKFAAEMTDEQRKAYQIQQMLSGGLALGGLGGIIGPTLSRGGGPKKMLGRALIGAGTGALVGTGLGATGGLKSVAEKINVTPEMARTLESPVGSGIGRGLGMGIPAVATAAAVPRFAEWAARTSPTKAGLGMAGLMGAQTLGMLGGGYLGERAGRALAE